MSEAQRARRARIAWLTSRLAGLAILLVVIGVGRSWASLAEAVARLDRIAINLNEVAVYFVLTLVVGMGAAVALILFISHRETVARDRRRDVEAGHTREVPG
jgi:hypothetical protein